MSKADSIPVFTELFSIEGVRLPDAAVFGAVWFYSYQNKRYCSKAPATIACELGLGVNTVRRSIAKLIALGLIEDTTPEVRNSPHNLRLTEKGRLLLPERLPKMGNQELVTNEAEVTQDGQPRLPKMVNQKPNRLPKMGNDNKKTKNLNKKTPTEVGSDSGQISHSDKSTLFPETESELMLFELINKERLAKNPNWRRVTKFPSMACKDKYTQAANVLNGQTRAMIIKANEQGFIAIAKVVNYVAGCAKNAGKYAKNRSVKGQSTNGSGKHPPLQQDGQTDRGGGNAAGVSAAFRAVREGRSPRTG